MALGAMLGGFWVQVGSQVGAKMAPKTKKKQYENYAKKRYKKRSMLERLREIAPPVGSASWTPRGGVGGGVFSKGKKKVGSRHLAKGRRICVVR